MDYSQIIPANTRAIQELHYNKAEQSELDLTKERISELETQVAELQAA